MVLYLIALVVLLAQMLACESPHATTGPDGDICRVEEAGGVCFHVIAHRGASAYAPENTLASLRKAIALGAAEIEMDVQLSADGVLMLFHDGTLDAKTNLGGPVSAHGARALEAADIGTWFDETHPEVDEEYAGTGIDRFEAALSEFGSRVHYHVELKSLEAELPGLVIEQVRHLDLLGRATLTSFDFAQVERARALAPQSPICWLLRSQLDELERGGARLQSEQRQQVDAARAAGFQMVAIRVNQLSREIIAYANAQGLQLRAYGIKGEQDMENAIALGAAGMTIDWPDRLLARMR